MATKKSANASKKVIKTPKKTAKQRTITPSTYKTLRLHKKIKPATKPIPKARRIFVSAYKHIIQNKRLFLGIIAVQIIFTLIFVSGFSVFSGGFQDTKSIVEQLTGNQSVLLTGITLLGVLVTSGSGGTSDVANLYGLLLLLFNGLAIIWSLRQTHAKQKPRLKNAYYKGMYPIVPFMLVLFVILLQLVPLIIGNLLYSIVISNGIAVTGLEQIIWLLLFIGLALLSLYMITSSIFALYIVTLPDVTPMQALRSARQLVLNRRMLVVRKLLFLPIALLLFLITIMLPIIIYASVIAQGVFFVLGNLGLLIAHAYLYELYRKLL